MGEDSIEAFRVISAGNTFDFVNYNQAVELINGKYEGLFL